MSHGTLVAVLCGQFGQEAVQCCNGHLCLAAGLAFSHAFLLTAGFLLSGINLYLPYALRVCALIE